MRWPLPHGNARAPNDQYRACSRTVGHPAALPDRCLDDTHWSVAVFLTLPFLALVGMLLPILAWLGLRKQREPDAGRDFADLRTVVLQIGGVQTLLLATGIVAVVGSGIRPGWMPVVSVQTIGLGIVVLAVVLTLSTFESTRPPDPANLVREALRSLPAFHPAWIAVTVYAGVVEEFAYRGLLTQLLATGTGYWSAALASALLFGLAHLASGWRAMAHGVVFALAMQWLVHASGGLLVAVVVHVIRDLVAARLANRLSQRNRRDRDEPP